MFLIRYAVLCGSAPDDYRQKKLIEMNDFLTDQKYSSVYNRNLYIFSNSINEVMLKLVLNKSFSLGAKKNLLFSIINEIPFLDSKMDIWLGGEKIRRDVIVYVVNFAKINGISSKMSYDIDREFVREEEHSNEKVEA